MEHSTLSRHFLTGLSCEALPQGEYYSAIPALQQIAKEGLTFSSPITFFAGENGMGKSTLIEGIAVAAGFNPEGGSRNFSFATAETHSGFYRHLTLLRGYRRPRDGFFLRAESFYNATSYIDRLDEIPAAAPPISMSYGGKSLHTLSHGEAFLTLVVERFGGNGLYILDEPEAALSPSRLLALLERISSLAAEGSQFLIATHSPILMACPHSELFWLGEDGIRLCHYTQTEHYRLTRSFLEEPEIYLKHLTGELPPQ